MATYKTPDGNTISADQDFIDAHYPGATLIAEPAPIAHSLGTRITPLAFLNRFGSSLSALYTAAQTNVAIQIYRDKILCAQFIDLARADTIAGVNFAAGAGLITSDQAVSILTDPVTEIEVPH